MTVGITYIIVLFSFLQNICTSKERKFYKRSLNGTIHVVAGGGGASLSEFSTIQPNWSIYRDFDYGFVKLTAFDHSNLLFEYKKSRDGKVYDSFRISRDYRDILACTVDSCPSMNMASSPYRGRFWICWCTLHPHQKKEGTEKLDELQFCVEKRMMVA